MSVLQVSGVSVMVSDLARQDIRPDLVRVRTTGTPVIVVDVGTRLVKPFLQQVPVFPSNT